MNTPLLPGYWRAMAAGWHPDPPGSSSHPEPSGSGTHPEPSGSGTHPEPSGSGNHPDPLGIRRPSDSELLAQALRSTRNRIVGPTPGPQLAPPAGKLPAAPPALWRWQRPYREAAVLTELMGLIVVEGLKLWWLPTASDLASGAKPQALFTLKLPAADFNWSEQIDKVLRAAAEREDRMAEVLSQRQDFSPFFDALTGLDMTATRRLIELMTVAANLATQVVMALKNTAAVWRPVQRSAQVHPMIATPGHGSLPSGHATVAALNASLLAQLLYQPGDVRVTQLDRLARRIAFNRVVAGVHFPIDSAAGYLLGRQLAQALIAAAGLRPRPAAPPAPEWPQDAALKENEAAPAVAQDAEGASADAERAPLWAQLWQATALEVQALRV